MDRVIDIDSLGIQITGRVVRVARLRRETYAAMPRPEGVIDALRACRTRIDLYTFIQRLCETRPLYRYPFTWENSAVLSISTFEHWWTRQLDNKTRNVIRKAEKKGVAVRQLPFTDTLVDGIWQIYNECPIRQGRRFRHYGKDLATVRSEEATFLDSSTFMGAFVGEEMIGFIKLVEDDLHGQAHLSNIVSMVRHRDKAPSNALIAQAVRCCADRGVPLLVYGKAAYGNKGPDGISMFKESNGFRRVDVPRYFVPLTPLGELALQLGLHRPLADRVPGFLAEAARGARASWYKRKFRAATEAL